MSMADRKRYNMSRNPQKNVNCDNNASKSQDVSALSRPISGSDVDTTGRNTHMESVNPNSQLATGSSVNVVDNKGHTMLGEKSTIIHNNNTYNITNHHHYHYPLPPWNHHGDSSSSNQIPCYCPDCLPYHLNDHQPLAQTNRSQSETFGLPHPVSYLLPSDSEGSRCSSPDRLSTSSQASSDYQQFPPTFESLHNKPDISDSEEDDRRATPCRKGRRGAKTLTLWQFILEVLDDRPDIAMWVDRREGTFKIVDTKGLSDMWGEKKWNKTMTFEKVSRAIRFTCNSGTLSRCGGARLMYKFNWPHVPKAYRKN